MVPRVAGGRPIRKYWLLLIAVLAAFAAGCSADSPPGLSGGAGDPPAPPSLPPAPARRADQRSLAVLIVVDQFRADYLTRFRPLLVGGLARIEREGLRFENALHLHATTQTSPGHASLATGLPPSRHGIIGNRWYNREAHELTGCVADPEYPGFAGGGGISPRQLLAPTLGEWIKKASPRSRVVSISGKDTAAVLMAGKAADAVFWYDRFSGRFTTSRFYASKEPELLGWFAGQRPVSSLNCATWDRLDGDGDLPQADRDDRPWEPQGIGIFPHRLPCRGIGVTPEAPPAPNDLASEVRLTPFLDDLTFDLVEAAVDRYELGQDGAPDLLAVSLSSTDYIGHRYGPDSQEVLDQIRRLDGRLGVFLDRLDRSVGLDHTLLVLTGDHGVTSCPERDTSRNARRVDVREFEEKLAAGLVSRLGPGRWLEAYESYQVYLRGVTERTRRAAIELLLEQPAVAAVYTREQLEGATEAQAGEEDPYLPLMRSSWTEARGGDLMIRVKDGWMITAAANGSDHGTPYPADMQVPLIFSGPGVERGSRTEPIAVYRAAATIAQLLDVRWPADLPGGPLPVAPGAP